MSKLKDELDKLSGRIVGSNTLQSPLDFWGRYDVWREAVKGLEKAIKRMEEKMERLTHERVNGIKTGYWSPEKKETLVNALAEYENTGLTPEEIKMLNGKGADAPDNDAWIPVEERMPDPEEDAGALIVTERNGNVWGDIYYGYANETDKEPCFHNWDDEMWRCFKPDVIAWRHMPEPYRTEK